MSTRSEPLHQLELLRCFETERYLDDTKACSLIYKHDGRRRTALLEKVRQIPAYRLGHRFPTASSLSSLLERIRTVLSSNGGSIERFCTAFCGYGTTGGYVIRRSVDAGSGSTLTLLAISLIRVPPKGIPSARIADSTRHRRTDQPDVVVHYRSERNWTPISSQWSKLVTGQSPTGPMRTY